MEKLLLQHLDILKAALLSLPATGNTGFEGLIGKILYDITGIPFRLAGSGSQFGIDGKAAYDTDTISYEGKRYKGKIPIHIVADHDIGEQTTEEHNEC